MKKLTTFALIILALFSGVLFSACGDKYKKLSMKIVYTDGSAVEELVLIKDSNKPELATRRIGIKFSGIDKDDIGQVAVYSSPSELFTTSNQKYSDNYVYIDITASKAATGELVVKHLSSNKTKTVNLRIEQKADDLTKRSEKYIVSVNGLAEGEKRVHTLSTKSLVSLYPSTSTDKVYFKEFSGNSLPNGVKKITESIDGVNYVTGFEISSNAVEQVDSFKLIPVTKMEGYEDKAYDNLENDDYEIVEIYFRNTLTNENVIVDTDDQHKYEDMDANKHIYDTVYLIANDVSADVSGKYNYNNVLFDLKTEGLGEISSYLDDYDISVIENSTAIQSTHTGNGRFVIQAIAHTDDVVEVEFKLTPTKIVGDVETITKKVLVKGEVKADTITTKKAGEEIKVGESEIVDIYNYTAVGNANGIKFNFSPVSKSNVSVYRDLAFLRIEIAPEILYLNAKEGVYTNVLDNSGNPINEGVSVIDPVNNRYLANQNKLIRFFKGNTYLNFQYDANNQVFVSEPFRETADIFIKYVETAKTDSSIDLKIKVTTKYEGQFNYLKNINKTEIVVNFEAKEGVKSLDIYAASFSYNLGVYNFDNVLDEHNNLITVSDIYINKDEIIKNTNEYALIFLEDNSIKGHDGRFLNRDVVFDVKISYNSTIKNPIGLMDVTGSLEISALDKQIPIIVDNVATDVGKYVITFSQKDTGFTKTINIYIYKGFNANEHMTLSFDEGELDNDSFKNFYFDGDDKKYSFAEYMADYIVYAGKTLNLTATINEEVLNSNIIKDYIYTPSVIKYVDDGRTLTPQITDDIVLNNYFNHTPNETYSGKTQLNFLKGSYYNDNYYYISYNVEIKTKKFKNILQEDVLNSDGGSLTLTFFIYEKIVVDKTVKANYIHPKQDMYMYDYLGYYNKNQGFADLQIVMTNEELWKYTQKYVVGEDEYSVNWKHNLGESVTNVVVFSNRDDATVTATFNKYGDSLQYTVVITAEIKQFNKTIPLTWEVLVLKPNITDEIRITSSAPRFNKISSKSAVTNSEEPFTNNIFEYDLDLQEGDKFTITADQFSNGGEVSHKGLTLVVTNSAGTTMYDVVGVDGNTIEVKRIQAGVKLIVFATDILSTDVYRYSAGFERPEQYIMEAESPNETKYMGSYFIINLHLEDGKTKETAYSVYNLSDFEQMMNETSGKWYRIMNDINLKGLKSFNKDFIGNVYGYHADCTLFDLELNATNKNLFKTFTGTMENICFETNYNYDSSTTSGNLGIIGTLNDGEILKYVKTIVSGESELNNPANEYNFGLLVGENKGTIAYYDKVEAGKYVGRKVTAVSGRFILKGESSVKFGGIAGVNSENASIIGENYNESDLSSLSQEITFATEAEQQGALVNINLVADEFENANSYIGGIVGENCGKLSNAYVTGVINAPNVSNVGGVVGWMNKTKTGEYSRLPSGPYVNNVSFSGTEVADIEHVKSSVVITGKDNVGGIVGKDEYGCLYKYCWYQILPTTSVAISGHNNVGGIVGYATHSKLQFCSVFSYKYDYADSAKYLVSLKNKDGSEKPADIIGKNYVAGLIGFAQNANLAPDNAIVTNSTIVRNSSVNAVIKAVGEDGYNNVGAIYGTNSIVGTNASGVIYSSYFIGKLLGTFGKEINTTNYDGDYLCLDNLGSSANNFVYTLNVEGNTFKSGKTKGFHITNASDFWNKFDGINIGYIYVSSAESENKPIFDLVPSSFDVVNIADDTKVLNKYFYDFSTSGASENELKLLNENFNQYDLLSLFDFTYAPGGKIMVAVRSEDTNVVDVSGDKLRIVGLGKTKLVFYPVLNPNLVCDIEVNIEDSLSSIIVTKDGRTAVTQVNVAKNGTIQLQTYSVGRVDATGITGLRKVYNYKSTKQYGLIIEVKWTDSAKGSIYYNTNSKISDYITINGADKFEEKTKAEDEYATLKAYIPYGTMLSFTGKQVGGVFDIKVTPCVSDGNAEYDESINLDYAVDASYESKFGLTTCQGATDISLNYNSVVVYPNDVTTLIATINTDIPLDNDDKILELLDSIYVDGEYIDLTHLSEFIEIKDIGTHDEVKSQQIVIFTVKIDSRFEEIKTPSELKINFKTEYTGFETVEYSILPQRIDKIEAKSYIYTNFNAGNIEQSEVLKPNNLGLLVIDIAPINGYFDYLEIDDVTGNEEIKFVQLDDINGKSLFEVDNPSQSGKGIKLVKVDNNKDGIIDSNSIYVTMQIDKNFSSKLHMLKISAYYQNGLAREHLKTDYKYLDVKMLPIIKVEHQLPNGVNVNYETESSETTTLDNDLFFAVGTSSQFRITTLNATEPLEYTLDDNYGGRFELVNTHGDFYILKNDNINYNDCGNEIVITLKAKSIINNDIEITTLKLRLKIVKFVIHSVSVTNTNSKGEIFGNIGVLSELKFYFKATDISYFDNGSYHETPYEYDKDMAVIAPGDDVIVTTRKSINNILKELNTNAAKYLILNEGENDAYTSRKNTEEGINELEKYLVINDTNISLTFGTKNKLLVNSGYNENAHLAVDMELLLIKDNDNSNYNYNWAVQPHVSKENNTIDLSKNYKLNFIKPYSEEDYMLVKNEEDFLAMESGKQNYYILGNDLVLDDYSPLDIEIAEFDGNGRTITIRSFAKFTEESIQAGLFKQVYESMTIKNVNVVYESKRVETVYSFGRVRTNNNSAGNVKDFNVEYADLCNDYTVNYTSAVFGGVTPTNNGVITNCTVSGEVALRASTVEINKTATTGGNYEIAFNIGGLVGTNSSSGYITHSTSGLKIFALANIGGLVYDNQGKIASSAVEDEALIYSYNINLERTILVKVGGFVSQNSGQVSMSHTTLNYSYTPSSEDVDEHYKGFMSTKDESAGFVHTNKGEIKNCYVQISQIGDHNHVYCGFVYSNTSGTIENCYTSINKGVDAGGSTYMFAQDGTQNLFNCLEFVKFAVDYAKDSSVGLKSINYDLILNNTEYIKQIFEENSFIFGNKNQAVWSMDRVELPILVSCEDKVRYTLNESSSGNRYFGLRNFEYVEKPIKNEDGSTSFELKVEFREDSYGTKSNPFVIYNQANWENRFYNNTMSYYRIVSDIEFTSLKNPTTSTMVFSGNIQGNDMLLSNIKLYLQEDVEAIGLFKTLQTADSINLENSVRNLNLEIISGWASKADAIGVMAGKAIGFNLYNITVNSPDVVLVGGNAVGGVVGYVGGEFDIDGISTNIGVNSTRELSSYRYSIYEGMNNKNTESNLTDVFYAGSAFGIVDGYNRSLYDINDPDGRSLEDRYYYVNHIKVEGDPVLIGDTVGGAFGFVGELVYVKNINVKLTGAQFKGYQYSAGVAGENRGIVENINVIIEGESFNETNYAAAGIVGLNIGGLIRYAFAKVDIVKNANISVGGILARNIYGTINNVEFDGVVYGNITGGIMAANYSKELYKSNNGAGAIESAVNLDLVVPANQVAYKDNGETINFENLVLSEKTLDYFIENIHKFYSYKFETKKVGENDVKSLTQQNNRAFGLFAAMTDIETSEIVRVYYIEGGSVVLNSTETELKDIDSDGIDEEVQKNSFENKNINVEYDSASENIKYVLASNENSFAIKENGSFENGATDTVRTINKSLEYVTVIYVTGANVTVFDSWDKISCSNDFIVFGNFVPAE